MFGSLDVFHSFFENIDTSAIITTVDNDNQYRQLALHYKVQILSECVVAIVIE